MYRTFLPPYGTGGGEADPAQARVVSMAAIVRLHPDMMTGADVLPGMNAVRSAAGAAWHREALEQYEGQGDG